MESNNQKPVSMNEFAYTQIRQDILNGTYTAGMKLQTQNLADKLGISRTPVVVAVNRLASEGYCTAIPQQGIFVRKFSYKSIHDILELRRMIELYTIDKIIESLSFDKSALQKLWDAANEYNNIDGDYSKALDVECNFHHTLISIAGNEEMLKVYKQSLCVEATYHMYRMANMPLRTVSTEYDEHAHIVELFEKGDREQVKQLMDKHIRKPLDMLDWLVRSGHIAQ